jgi:thymidylate synthase (FAD)
VTLAADPDVQPALEPASPADDARRGPDRRPVLDHGYVRLVDRMGSDLSVVNAAKVSFDKEATDFGPREERLLQFLGREGHTSPFRHAALSFEVFAPLMVARQWWKYVVGSDHTMEGWNESSRRYVTEEPTFYSIEPTAWRSAPANRKQGSGEPLPVEVGRRLSAELADHYARSLERYEAAIADGVAVEQARVFLPAYALYVRWRWTASLQAVGHFLAQRLADDAQREIAAYASAVRELTEPYFPHALAAMIGAAGSPSDGPETGGTG